MQQIELEILQKSYPNLFLPSKRRKFLAYVIGVAGIVLGIGGLVIELVAALISPGPGLPVNPISLVICGIIGVVGYKIFRSAPDNADEAGWTPYAQRCQAIYDEIEENGYAHKHGSEFDQCIEYSLEELVEVFETMNREGFKERFETISFLIKEKLSGR